MIILDNTLISEDVLDQEFVCNLTKCKGACCVEGEFGAPLDEEEIAIIEGQLDAVKPYMTPAALRMLEKEGFYETDPDGDLVTKCLDGADCIFAMKEGNVYKCAMEKAYEEGKVAFKKPISCHLYPIRIDKVGEYEALNYNRWDICSDACSLGSQLHVPVYKFLKESLTRKYGPEWYAELEKIAAELGNA